MHFNSVKFINNINKIRWNLINKINKKVVTFKINFILDILVNIRNFYLKPAALRIFLKDCSRIWGRATTKTEEDSMNHVKFNFRFIMRVWASQVCFLKARFIIGAKTDRWSWFKNSWTIGSGINKNPLIAGWTLGDLLHLFLSMEMILLHNIKKQKEIGS